MTVPTVSPLTRPAAAKAAEPAAPESVTPNGLVTFVAVTVRAAGVTVLPEATVWIEKGFAPVEAIVIDWLL